MRSILKNIPKAVANLIYINLIIYLAVLAFPAYEIDNKLALYNPFFKEKFHFYQFLSHMFVHSREFFHLLFNMMGLWMFGSQMEKILGVKPFLIIYFACGFSAALLQVSFNLFVVYNLTSSFNYNEIDQYISIYRLDKIQLDQLRNAIFSPMVGASGAVFGIVGAFAKYFPHHKIFIFPIPFPIAVKKALILFLTLSTLASVFNIYTSIAHFAHIGGVLMGYLIANYYFKQQKFSKF